MSGVAEDGDRFYASAMEVPMRVASPFASKEALERAQLEKYRLDYLLQHGHVPFEQVRRGNGVRPDFVVESRGGPLALDCAALALEERRQAEALFARLHERLASHGSAAFSHLARSNILLWFGRGDGQPPRPADRSLDEELDEALATVAVDRDALAKLSSQIARTGFPAEFPPEVRLPIVQRDRFGFSVTPVVGWAPRGDVARELGFNLILRFQVTVRRVRTELERVVAKHDNADTEALLLSVGGPDRNGLRYPTESLIGRALKESELAPVRVRYLQSVTVHLWEGGEILPIAIEALAGEQREP